MWEDSCRKGKTLLTPASISKLSLAITDLFNNLIKDFPDELIPEVLIRLPIKPLVKCTLVCQSWMSMIKDPTFIRTHLTHKRSFNTQNATHLLLLHTVFGEDIYNVFGKTHIEGFKEDIYTLHYDNPAFGEYCKIEFPVVLKQGLVNSCFRVVASCNGLICISDDLEHYAYNFVLWNPCVRKYVMLPEPFVQYSSHGGYEATIGLGYDAVTNDYKVVRVATLIDVNESLLDPTIAQVYSLAKGSWSRLRSDLPPCQMSGCSPQAFVNGVVHWLALGFADGTYNYFVLTFDVGSESFGEIMLPMKLKLDESLMFRLSVSGDQKSIALFVRGQRVTDSFLDIWLMKEYCVEKSWTKLMILTPQGPERSLPAALCFRKSGEVVLAREDDLELVSVDLVSKQSKSLGITRGLFCNVLPYEESLVLLDSKDAASY